MSNTQNMLISRLVMFLALTAATSSQLNQLLGHMQEDEKLEHMLATAIVNVLENGIVRQRHERGFNLFAHALETKHLSFFGDVIDRTLQLLPGAQIAVRTGMQRSLYGDHSRHYSVLLVDSEEALRVLYGEILRYHLNIIGYYIILLYNFRSHYNDDLYDIVQLNWEVGVVDANVLIHALPDLVLVFSGFPYTPYHCSAVAPVIINQFLKYSWQSSTFFPEKLVNLFGCPVECATWQELPYFGLKTHPRTGRRHYIGIEGNILQYLTELNFSVNFRWMTEEEITQTLDADGLVFHKFFKNGTEFSFGAFHYKPTTATDHYAPTTGYYHSSYYFIVSAETMPFGPISKLLFPFANDIWSLIGLVFCAGIIITVFARCLKNTHKHFMFGANNNTPIYNMFVITLGGSLSTLPGRNFARFVMLLWIVGSLVLRVAYQALLYHFIRTDLSVSPPHTVNDIIEKNYRIFMTDFVFVAIRFLRRIRSRAVLLNGSEYENFDMLRGDHQQMAILTPFEYFGYFRRTHVDNADFYVVPEVVFTQRLSIYMRRNSIFLRIFDRNILNFNSAGLMHRAESQFVDTNIKPMSGGDVVPQKMQLRQLLGSFLLWLLGNMLAVLVLLFELIWNMLLRLIQNRVF